MIDQRCLMKSVLMLWLGGMLAACDNVVGHVGSTTEPGAEQGYSVPVEVTTLTTQSLRPEINVVGTIQSAEQIDLTAEVTAPVARILVREGQLIKKGELLIELDARKLQLQLIRSQENLKQAKSRVAEAASALQRREQLAAQQTLSQEMLDSARYEFQRSRAAWEEANAAVRLAQRDLDGSRILSPVDGVVERKLVDVGEAVMPGVGLMTLHSTSTLEVKTYVSERDINLLSVGATATVTITGWQTSTQPAVVRSVGMSANPRTGNFPVTLTLQEANASIRPGMTAKARIQANAIERVLLLPEQAVVDRGRNRVVFVVEDGKAAIRQPRLKAGLSDRLIVLDGLREGERVIVSGLDRVVDNVAVTPLTQR